MGKRGRRGGGGSGKKQEIIPMTAHSVKFIRNHTPGVSMSGSRMSVMSYSIARVGRLKAGEPKTKEKVQRES